MNSTHAVKNMYYRDEAGSSTAAVTQICTKYVGICMGLLQEVCLYIEAVGDGLVVPCICGCIQENSAYLSVIFHLNRNLNRNRNLRLAVWIKIMITIKIKII
jgi:hypothetical protein